MARILIVEDEPMIIETLKAYLEKENFQVEALTNGADALIHIPHIRPDFIILDLMLPDISGEEICYEVRKYSDVPIMMLTAKSNEECRVNGIQIGADDYIVKPFSPKEVVVRIKGILRRVKENSVYSRSLSFNSKELLVDLSGQRITVNGCEISLTPIELKILFEMAKFPGQVFSRCDLLKKIQEDSYYEGYERIIDVHIKNIRKKIEKDPRTPVYILTVFGIGYKFGGNLDVS